MAAEKSNVRRLHNKGCAVNIPTHELFVNFAARLEISRRSLATRYVEEQQGIFKNVDMDNLDSLFEAQRRVLPGYAEYGSTIVPIAFSVLSSTFEHYKDVGDRLDRTFSYLTRTAIYNGLALDIEQTDFVVPPIKAAS